MMNQTFGGIAEEFSIQETAKIWLQSIPYDGTSTWGKGADEGFYAFLDAAENMELYDIETDSEVYKQGIHMLDSAPPFISPEEMFEWTYQRTKELLNKEKFLTFFGGEHSISIGIIKAFYEHFDNLTVLQIDAHADQRPSYEGTAYNHACAVHDAGQNCNLLQVGIRSMDVGEKQYMNSAKTWYGHEIAGKLDWIGDVVAKMTDQVYVTVDLDAFDSSIMPATGTPEPGGMNWEQVIGLLRETFTNRTVVGFDIVELAPIPNLKAPQFLAAKLYYKMLSYKFKK
jgi:agmatinase